MVAPLRVGIAGLGTVGAEVVRLIEAQSRTLSERSGRGVRVVAVTARSKAKKRSLDLRGIEWAKSPLALANDPNIDCFVELMGGSGEPALSAIEAALKSGKSVVTANKALIAKHGIAAGEGRREAWRRAELTRRRSAPPFRSSRPCARGWPAPASTASTASSTAPAITS